MDVNSLLHDFYIETVKTRCDTLRYFVDFESNVERWFKVEFAHFLQLQGLQEFRERKVNGMKRIDVGIEDIGKTVYFELKHLKPMHDTARTPVRLWFNSYIEKDIVKLHNLVDTNAKSKPEFNEKYQLTFVSAEASDKTFDERIMPGLTDFLGNPKEGVDCNLIISKFEPDCCFGYYLLKVNSWADSSK